MCQEKLEARIKQAAESLGFSAVGICPATQAPHYREFLAWLEAGYHGEMAYMEERRAAYSHPNFVLPGAKSLIVLAFPYKTVEPQPCPPSHGRISRYAWGLDYHRVMRRRLRRLEALILESLPDAQVRSVVDTAPLLERSYAVLAGLGWIGKNTLLVHPVHGSWVFLAAILTTAELQPDAPFGADRCGSCTACLGACPTGALIAPRVLDARRCLSYLNIEMRSDVPKELRDKLGDWFFGCDICQEVCPWNRKVAPADVPEFYPLQGTTLELPPLFSWSDEQFQAVFGRTPLWRARRRGLLRNAALVLASQRYQGAVSALQKGLSDPDPVVQAACRWAMERIKESRTP